MSDQTPPNVKVFDRPEKKGLSPLILGIIVLAVLAAGFFGYRAFVHPSAPAAPAAHTQTGSAVMQSSPARFATGNFAEFSFVRINYLRQWA